MRLLSLLEVPDPPNLGA
ncbi:hypothetical protein S40285_10752 [Stachybotrys chlorohalonatus IBT 40285]|uniref:Uncharacterized protein n=1 Tax=Stachybotrys chlorohalonatus (strain IBT 40285) TaxID=1283841 RepID=A0A084R231_STAC4|nr:hypothetical protein S40285_10752 [Stachybotrys chlorohalonata IBT 40285]